MSNFFKKRGQRLLKKASVASERHIKENLFSRLSHVGDVRLYVLEWGLLVFALLMLALTQSFWYSDSYSFSGFGSGGTYTEATLGKVSSLNPLFASTNSEKTLSRLLFSSLTVSDASGHTGNLLASSVRSDETGKIWTVKLKEGLKWSDGEPLTVNDVIFTANLIKNPSVISSYSANLSGVNLKKDDKDNLIFELKASYADFASALNFPILPEHILGGVEPEKLLEAPFSTNPVSSGAFSFNASQTIGTEGESVVYLTENKNYFKKEAYIDSFVIHAYPTVEEIKTALNSGKITATAELLPTDAEEITSKNIYEKQTTINAGTYIFLNTKSPVLKNKSLRKAIQKGIDTEELRSLTSGEPALKYPILKNQVSLSEWPALPERDLEDAKEIIEDAEVSDKVLSLVTVSTGYFPVLAEDLKAQLEELGFKVSVSVYDPGQDFVVNVITTRSYDLLLYEIELGADPDILAYYHSSQATQSGLNLSNYNNPLADDLILAARETVNDELRSAKYVSFLKHWIEDVPAIGVYQVNISYFFDKNSKTFSEDNSLATAIDRFNDVEYWAIEKTIKNRTP
ncbi:hypothetical protein IJG21_00390 [Candidatus Saccharibacteria bacterium]|nr:hypothetical protein [Candidatus Saccharibacteria bacterium]